MHIIEPKVVKQAPPPQVEIDISQYRLDYREFDGCRLAVWENHGKPENPYRAEVHLYFNDDVIPERWAGVRGAVQKGYKKAPRSMLKLQAGLTKFDNTAYKKPQNRVDFSDSHNALRAHGKTWAKKHGVDLHAKMGCEFPNRWQNLLGNWFSYDPVLNEVFWAFHYPISSNENPTNEQLELSESVILLQDIQLGGEQTYNNSTIRWETFEW